MAILVIKSDEISDMLFNKINQSILDGISDANKEIDYFNINSLKFKACIREACSEREFDKNCPMGCRKHRECIECWNANIADSVYVKMIAAEAIVFFIKDTDRALRIFVEVLSEKEHDCWKRNEEKAGSMVIYSGGLLKDKKVLFVTSPGEYEYSHGVSRRMVDYIDKLRRSLRMHIIDMFVVDSDNENYMLPVIRYAVSTLCTIYQDLNKDVNEWFKHHYEENL